MKIRVIFLSILFFLPFSVFAEGPEIQVDTKENTVGILTDDSIGNYALHTIQFADKVKDIQAARIQRDNTYYVVVLARRKQKIRLQVYTAKGEQMDSHLVFHTKKEKRFTSAKMNVVAADDALQFRVQTVRVNSADQPKRYLIKQYKVEPTEGTIIKRTDSSSSTITAPDRSSSNDEAVGLALVNYQRLSSGILPVTRSADLDHGCALHVEYMRLNDILSHSEDSTKSGYTEEGNLAGMSSDLAEQSDDRMDTGIEIWTTAIYHRLPLFANGLQKIGWAISAKKNWYYFSCVNVYEGRDYKGFNDFGRDNNVVYYNPSNHSPIPYPGVNQTQIPPKFDTGEEPDPIEALGGEYPVGQPVSLTFSDEDTVTDMSMSMKDSSGHGITGYFRAPDDATDPNTLYQGNTVSFIPKAPLHGGQTYTVTVTGKVNGDSYSKTWSFTTE